MKKIRILLAAMCCVMTTMVYAVCTPVNVTYLNSSLDCSTDNSTIWTWDSYNYVKATAYNLGLEPSEAHLFTPSLDLSGSLAVTLSFSHIHRYCSNPSDELTLWVTDDYKGSYATSSWHQLTINAYADQTAWKPWIDVTVDVPAAYVGSNTVFSLQYKWTSSSTGTWEVKNLKVVSECTGGETASPVAVPNVGDARLKVFAQNLRNYYFNTNTGRGSYTPEEFATKTNQLIDAMRWVDADIFAFCELEAQPIVLKQLADSINKRVGENIYVAVDDDINEAWDAQYDNNLKSGFIYRKDKVKPYGTNHAGSTAYYYCNTMRIQVFEELATGARFTLSMNHFKAKDNTEDQGNAKRELNANQMINGLNSYSPDPDILAVGDFNCQVGESPITIITNAGYEEQILKYSPSAFSHCYNGRELIDHAFANTTMAAQITGAGMYHICTSCSDEASQSYGHRYSDHDAYVIGLNLDIPASGGDCEDIDVTYLTNGMSPLTSEQNYWYWTTYNNDSYAKISKSGGVTDYMKTPEMNMTDMSSVSISFQHAHKFAGTPSNELTLWVTGDYQGDFASSTWQQLMIDPYTNNSSWNWADVTINVPTSYVGAHTVFAFKYMSTASDYATWEIKNLNIKATCKQGGEGIENVLPVDSRCQKALENGQLILILPDGTKYNVIGVKIQ